MSQHFGSRLKSEVIPEWQEYYIGYAHLKRCVQIVEKEQKKFMELTEARMSNDATSVVDNSSPGLQQAATAPAYGTTMPAPTRTMSGLNGGGGAGANAHGRGSGLSQMGDSQEEVLAALMEEFSRGLSRADGHVKSIVDEITGHFQQLLEANSDLAYLFDLAAIGGGAVAGSVSDHQRITAPRPTNFDGSMTATRRAGTASAAIKRSASAHGLFPSTPVAHPAVPVLSFGDAARESVSPSRIVLPSARNVRFSAPTLQDSSSRNVSGKVHRPPKAAHDPTVARESPPAMMDRADTAVPVPPAAAPPRQPSPVQFPDVPLHTATSRSINSAEEAPMMEGSDDELAASAHDPYDLEGNFQRRQKSGSGGGGQQQRDHDTRRSGAYRRFGRYDDTASHATSVFGAVMQSAKGSMNAHSKADLERPEDPQLAFLVDLNESAVKTFRFCELNQLSAQRILHKYERYVLAPFREFARAVEAKSLTVGGDVSAAVDARLKHYEQTALDLKALVASSPLVEKQKAVELYLGRIREVAERLYGEEIVQRYFVASVASHIDVSAWTIKWPYVVLSFVLLGIVLAIPMLPDNQHAHNCAAMFACIVTLWVTEAIPFFTTAMFIPLLAVPLHVLPNMTRGEIGSTLLGVTFDHVQILVLGGLCMSKALSKHRMELYASRICLRPIAHRPRLFVLVLMLLAAFACAVLSNVAAPVLVLNVVQPTLWRMQRASGAPQAILLCLAFACNFGGMLTPIASPQNAVAVKALGDNGISYVTWLCAALPIVLLGIFVAWAVVLRIWRPFPDETYVIPVPGGDRSSQEEDELAAALLRRGANAAAHQNFLMSDRVEKVLVLATCLATIILWCIPADLTFGDTGVIALIPIVIFFGMGVLRKDDFNSLSWHLLFLLGGGNMLGVCARESGLLDAVVNLISPFLQTHTNFAVVSVLIVCVAVVTTFVSHTVAALILMPVVVQIASVNPNLPSASALVFMCVIMCSGSMAFPITSFPNVNSLLAEDEHGKPYLVPKHFLLAGSILSSMCVASLITFMLPMTQALLPK